MEKSEKNFLEKLADAIPGLSGYRGRDERRETDKRLREYVASRIDRVRGAADDLKLALTDKGDLAALGGLGTLQRRLQQLGDSIRFATYGYTGLFDQIKIREAELEAIYAHDLNFVAAVEAIEKSVASADLAGAEAALKQAETLFAGRKDLFEKP